MKYRIPLLFLLFLLMGSKLYAQVKANFEDTVYYNLDFKKTQTKYVHYYRPPVVKEGDRYKVEYYTIDNKPVFKGSVRSAKIDYHYSIEPGVATKDGYCIYYNKDGNKRSEGEYSYDYKIGTWKYYYKDGALDCVESYYNEQPAMYETNYYEQGGKMMEGLKLRVAYGSDTFYRSHGLWTSYYKNGKVSSIENYDLGNPRGQHIYYDTNGIKIAEGNLSYWDTKDGKWTFYDRVSQTVRSVQNYKRGLLDGEFVQYHTPTGKVLAKGMYNKGVRTGTWLVYHPGSDKIMSRAEYENNVGRVVFYDSVNTDRVWLEGKVEGNMRTGEWVQYHPANGVVSARQRYEKNLMHGKLTVYDSTGGLFYEMEFKKGVASGRCTYYYPGTGEKWVVLDLAADTFTGFVHTYYENGKLKRKTREESGELKQTCYDRNGNMVECPPFYTPATFGEDIMTYIGNNLEYPEEAKRMRLEGKVKIGFMIDEFGKVEDPYVIEGFDPRCDEAALTLVSQMPNWIPLTVDDIPVKSYKTLPIVFWLPAEEEAEEDPSAGL